MATRRLRRREGPRQAARWIGDAFILDGDLTADAGVAAVFFAAPSPSSSGKREPRCARARLFSVSRDWEFGVDELPLFVAAAAASGVGLVPRLATYWHEDSESILAVDDDVADLTLRDLLEALAAESGDPHVPLALYVARSLLQAMHTASDVVVDINPRVVALTWDGRLLCRATLLLHDTAELVYAHDDPLDVARYWSSPQQRIRVVGCIAYELLRGEHPLLGDEEGDVEDPDELRVDELVARMEAMSYEPVESGVVVVDDLLDRLLANNFGSVVEALSAVERVLSDLAPGFGAGDVKGLLTGLFGKKRRDDADAERDDRLRVLPGPKIEQALWPLLEQAHVDDAERELYDLDDVRKGRGDWGLDGEAAYEPSVAPVDPFDDE